MPKIELVEEYLAPGAIPRYAIDEQTVILYLTPSKQFARVGPGLQGGQWDCPLLTNLTMAEVSRLKLEGTKLLPNATQMRFIQGQRGWGLCLMTTDATFVPPKPAAPPFDYSTAPGEQRALWGVCKNPSHYVPTSSAPDCGMNCKKYHKLEGKMGIDWGVCEEPQSPRAGLLTFRHMSCNQYEPKVEEPVVEEPVTKPDIVLKPKTAKDKPKAKPSVPAPPLKVSDGG